MIIAVAILVSAVLTAAQTPFQGRGCEPQLFAPQLWSDGEEVYGGTFTDDGRRFYFFKKVGPENFRIVEARWSGDGWRGPFPVDFSATTSDLYPAVSRDGTRIVFTSYRRVPGDTSARPNGHLWMVERNGDTWTEPRPLLALLSLGDYHPGVKMLHDGTLYFRVISRTDRATYRAPYVDGRYPRRERVRSYDKAQTPAERVWGAEPAPDGSRFFLTTAPLTAAPSTWGPADVYVANADEDGWTVPSRLSSRINTNANESAVTATPDGQHLLFTRDGRMYQVRIGVPCEWIR
jgi:hypothetical protein